MVEGRENFTAASAAYLNNAVEPTAPMAVGASSPSVVARRLSAGVRVSAGISRHSGEG